MEEAGIRPPAEVGEVLSGYRLDRIIGRGGMGYVYAATHLDDESRVAIKILAHDFSVESRFAKRFFREARLVNEVRHPNVIDIFQFIELESPRRLAYAMELIDGPTLTRFLEDGPLTAVQAINVALQLVDALEAVHDRGIIHRDLKPDNVLVTVSRQSDFRPVPSVKILDFGIAKFTLPSGEQQTKTGMMVGTPQYMAPEQVSASTVTAAADVYAIGELLFEMLTGKPLFRGDTITLLRTKLAPTPMEIPSETGPPKLVALISDCVKLEPSERPTLEETYTRLLEIVEPLDAERTVRALNPIEPVPLAFVTTPEAATEHMHVTGTELAQDPSIVWMALVLVACAVSAFAATVWIKSLADAQPERLEAIPIEIAPLSKAPPAEALAPATDFVPDEITPLPPPAEKVESTEPKSADAPPSKAPKLVPKKRARRPDVRARDPSKPIRPIDETDLSPW
jgi:serine/threonine-protein kinase